MPVTIPQAESDASIGYLGEFRIGTNASPPVFSALMEVTDCSGFGFTPDLLEVTHWKSPGRKKEFKSGMQDGDVITITLNYTAENKTVTLNWASAGLTTPLQLYINDTGAGTGSGCTYRFSGSPNGWHLQGLQANAIKQIQLGVKVTGDITEDDD